MRRGWCFSFHRRGNWGKKQIWDLSSDPAHAPRTLHDLSLNWIFPRFSFIQTYWVFFSECFFRVSQPFCCQSLCFPFTGVVYNGKGCLLCDWGWKYYFLGPGWGLDSLPMCSLLSLIPLLELLRKKTLSTKPASAPQGQAWRVWNVKLIKFY